MYMSLFYNKNMGNKNENLITEQPVFMRFCFMKMIYKQKKRSPLQNSICSKDFLSLSILKIQGEKACKDY